MEMDIVATVQIVEMPPGAMPKETLDFPSFFKVCTLPNELCLLLSHVEGKTEETEKETLPD